VQLLSIVVCAGSFSVSVSQRSKTSNPSSKTVSQRKPSGIKPSSILRKIEKDGITQFLATHLVDSSFGRQARPVRVCVRGCTRSAIPENR